MTVVAESVLDISLGGSVRYSKSPDLLHIPASVMKTMTLYVARQTVTDAMLEDTVTVASSDLLGGSTAHLQAGDVLTWNDLFHGMMMPSGNDAATCVARVAGGMLPGSGDPYERFLARMNAACSEFGWAGANCASPSGLDTDSRLSVRQVCDLLFALGDYEVGIMGTQRWAGTITGPNAREQVWKHSVKPDGAVPIPEMVAAKSGTLFDPPTANLALLWNDRAGTRHALATLHSTRAARYSDARTVLDTIPVAQVQVGGDPRNVVRARHHVGGVTREIASFESLLP